MLGKTGLLHVKSFMAPVKVLLSNYIFVKYIRPGKDQEEKGCVLGKVFHRNRIAVYRYMVIYMQSICIHISTYRIYISIYSYLYIYRYI